MISHLRNCYFCTGDNYSSHAMFTCIDCMSKYDLQAVFTVYQNKDDKDDNYPSINISSFGMRIIINSNLYDIITSLEPHDKHITTRIWAYDKDNALLEVINLPGKPFTLQNVKKKLPLYLTFL